MPSATVRTSSSWAAVVSFGPWGHRCCLMEGSRDCIGALRATTAPRKWAPQAHPSTGRLRWGRFYLGTSSVGIGICAKGRTHSTLSTAMPSRLHRDFQRLLLGNGHHLADIGDTAGGAQEASSQEAHISSAAGIHAHAARLQEMLQPHVSSASQSVRGQSRESEPALPHLQC